MENNYLESIIEKINQISVNISTVDEKLEVKENGENYSIHLNFIKIKRILKNILKDISNNKDSLLNYPFDNTKKYLDDMYEKVSFLNNNPRGISILSNFKAKEAGGSASYDYSAVSDTLADLDTLTNEILIENKNILEFLKLDKARNIAKDTSEEILSIRDNVKKAAGQTVVSKYSWMYKNEALEYKWISIFWTEVLVILSSVIICLGIYMMYYSNINYSNIKLPEIIEISILRVIIFSVLTYMTMWSAKNYNANRHNYILNMHRHNVMNTFETLSDAATDKNTKNSILLQASSSIFSTHATGYNLKEPEIISPNNFIEVLKTMGNK